MGPFFFAFESDFGLGFYPSPPQCAGPAVRLASRKDKQMPHVATIGCLFRSVRLTLLFQSVDQFL